MDDNEQTKTGAASQANNMALVRTLLASDRTLLAWIRTSISLFGFGFTLAKFLHNYIAKAGGPPQHLNANSARNMGMAMLILGLAGLVGGMWEHYQCLTALKASPKTKLFSPACLMAMALAVVGMFLIVDVFSEFW